MKQAVGFLLRFCLTVRIADTAKRTCGNRLPCRQAAVQHSALSTQHSRGITLLELAIVLAVAGVVVFIALPTLKPTREEAVVIKVKALLRDVHKHEQLYFKTHGKYAPLPKLAADPVAGRGLDKRFAKEPITIDGIVFAGPQIEIPNYEVVAVLPKEAGRYKIDQSGKISSLQ